MGTKAVTKHWAWMPGKRRPVGIRLDGDVIGAISDLDADVLFIENARSELEMLEVFRSYGCDKGVGPGVYNIHSPRVPPVEEMVENLRQTVSVVDSVQV